MNHIATKHIALWCAAALACGFLQPLQAQPLPEQPSLAGAGLSIVTSIRPLALIANDILAGHGTAKALMGAGDSPHHYTLSPSARLNVARADLLVWVGADLEVALGGLFGDDPRTITASTLDNMLLYQLESDLLAAERTDKAPSSEQTESESHSNLDHHASSEPHDDLHLWLSTANAEIIARAISAAVSRLDAANAEHYAASLARFETQQANNREAFAVGFAALKSNAEGMQNSSSADTALYAVYHDAYRYFENEFGLSHTIALLADPERAPTIRELSEVIAALAKMQPRCLLTEPDADTGLIATATKGLAQGLAQRQPLRQVEVDILGRNIADGEDGYTRLMRAVVANFVECLK